MNFNRIRVVDSITQAFDHHDVPPSKETFAARLAFKSFLNTWSLVENDDDFHDLIKKLIKQIDQLHYNFKVHSISLQLINISWFPLDPQKPVLWERLPLNIWKKIFSYIPPKDPNLSFKRIRIASDLIPLLQTSKFFAKLSHNAKIKWMGEELINLKINGPCESFEKVINLISKNNLKGANLLGFEVTNDELEKLFETCPNLNQLIVRSKKLTKIPEAASRLKHLNCSWCPLLESLPEQLPEVEILNCSYCSQLKRLPKHLPKLQMFDCTSCFLEDIPNELSDLKELYCSNCAINLPEQLPKLKILEYSIDNLENYPQIPEDCLLLQ